jgi:hypothetical protein
MQVYTFLRRFQETHPPHLVHSKGLHSSAQHIFTTRAHVLPHHHLHVCRLATGLLIMTPLGGYGQATCW